MLQYWDKRITENRPELYAHIQKKHFSSLVRYVIDSRYRTSVKLTPWIKGMVENPGNEVTNFLNVIPKGRNQEETVMNTFKAVTGHVRYTGDHKQWKRSEYWQTAAETIKLAKGDCEDGAIAIYVLCRLQGVPANRLLLMAGSVHDPFTNKIAGHCWVGYRPDNYPLNWVFLDWCYYYTPDSPLIRSKFYVFGKKITEYKGDYEGIKVEKSNYYNIWFAFNDEKSYNTLLYMND